MTLPRSSDPQRRTQSFSKQRRQFLFWTVYSAFAHLTLIKRMNSFEKTLIKLLVITVTIILFFWYADIQFKSVPENVITINRETWKILQDRIHLADKIQLKNRDEDIAKQNPLKQKKPLEIQSKIKKTFKSAQEKDEWMFQILKDSDNLKADPSAPRDSSYSIMINGVREPLDDPEPVVLVWWPPDYLNNKKENWLEREFQGVCGKCRLTTDRSTLPRSNVVLFDNIPMNTNLEDLPPKDSRYAYFGSTFT